MLAPAGWYPDPDGSGGLRWWDGTRWTVKVPPKPPPPPAPSRLPVAPASTALAAVRAGGADIGRRRGLFTRLVLGTAAAVVGLYLVVTLGNSLVFRYDFFNEPTPSASADTALVISLWLLAAAEAAVITLAFGALSGAALGATSARTALRAGARQLRHDWWWAIVAMVAAGFAVLLVVPGPFVGLLAAVAVQRVDRATGQRLIDRGYVGRATGQHLLIGLLPALASLAIWITASVGSSFAHAPALVSVPAVLLAVVAMAAVAALTAAASAQVLFDDRRRRQLPPPVPMAPA